MMPPDSLDRGLVHQLRRELNATMTGANYKRLHIMVGERVREALARVLKVPVREVYWFKGCGVHEDAIDPLDFVIEEWP